MNKLFNINKGGQFVKMFVCVLYGRRYKEEEKAVRSSVNVATETIDQT